MIEGFLFSGRPPFSLRACVSDVLIRKPFWTTDKTEQKPKYLKSLAEPKVIFETGFQLGEVCMSRCGEVY